jgi:hypothetical protein
VTAAELVGALAFLPDDAQVTITVRVADLRASLEAKAGGSGPEFQTSTEIAKRLGYSSYYWSKLAKSGRIPGATRDGANHWRLPVAACAAHIRGHRRRSPSPSTRPLAIVRGKPRVPKPRPA